MATNNTFSVKNGLTIGNTTVIAANGVWVGANTNLIGPQGVQGAQGTQGVQGTVGAQGTIGAQGDVGAQGAIGAQGSAGAQGFTGAQGATGPQGVQGFNGTQGAQGDIGAQGPTGPTGPQGPTGSPGAQGVQGQTGSPGAQGVQGFNGTQGAQGVQGAVGAQGPQGVQGFNGTQGATGPTGPQGVQGASGTATPYEQITANTNAIGNTQYLADTSGGPFNLTLPASPNFGSTIIITDGIGDFSTNNLTILRNGSTIANIADDVALNLSNSVSTLVYTGTTWQFITTAGTIGAQGVQGATGPQGSQGLAGAQGVLGAQGVQGVQGVQGATGAQGVQGSTGPQGVQGAQGITGTIAPYQQITANTNAIGNTQYLADTSGGSFNLTLPASPNFGSTILIADGTGSFSTNNLTVLNNGSTIANQNADLLLNLSNTVSTLVYTGTTWQFITTAGTVGAQGAQGVQGIAGAQGVQGVLGAQGAQGVQGATGPQGSQGVTGPQGVQGIQGAVGSQGVQGAVGAQGVQGAVGAQGVQGSVGAQGVQGAVGAQGVQGATPAIGGSNTQIQFNNGGALSGSANLIFDGTGLGIGINPIATGLAVKDSIRVVGAANTSISFSNAYNQNYAKVEYDDSTGNFNIFNTRTYPLILGVNNAEKIRFSGNTIYTASGVDVGIGTTNPVQKLQVNGAVGNPATSGSTQNGLTRLSNTTDNGVLDIGIKSGGTGAWLQSTDGGASGMANQYPLLLNPVGGNVGINESNPPYKLTVAGTGYFQGPSSDTAGQAGVFINYGNAAGVVKRFLCLNGNGVTNAALGLNQIDANNGDLVISTLGSGTLTERIRLTYQGNFLLGTQTAVASCNFLASQSADTTAYIMVENTSNTASASAAVRYKSSDANIYAFTGLACPTRDVYGGLGPNVTFFYTSSTAGMTLMVDQAGPITFCNGSPVAEKMRLDSSGNLLVGTTTTRANAGDVQVSKGISFPATQSAQSDANTLDDYEEGTWTPSITGDGTAFAGTTYTARAGKYVKVGDVVWVSYDITVDNAGTLNNAGASISGIPFTVPNSSDLSNGGGGIGYITGIQQNYVYQSCYPQNNSNYLYIIGRTAASTSTVTITATTFYANSTRISGWAWYRTTV